MSLKIKTVWEQWIDLVEARWPMTATQISELCNCDFKTGARIRDHVASIHGQEPPRSSGGLRPVQVDDAVVDEIANNWPVSLKEIMRRYGRGKTVARRLQKAAIARHELEPNQRTAKRSALIEESFRRLDEYVAQHGKTNRDAMRHYARCSWSTITAWRKARGIYEPAFATAKKRDRVRAANGIGSEPMQRTAKAVRVVPIKPQHYAPGQWFRNKRTGETVPALFCVSGSEVKFFRRVE